MNIEFNIDNSINFNLLLFVFILFVFIVIIGSLTEEYIVNKSIRFSSWKIRLFTWIGRLL